MSLRRWRKCRPRSLFVLESSHASRSMTRISASARLTSTKARTISSLELGGAADSAAQSEESPDGRVVVLANEQLGGVHARARLCLREVAHPEVVAPSRVRIEPEDGVAVAQHEDRSARARVVREVLEGRHRVLDVARLHSLVDLDEEGGQPRLVAKPPPTQQSSRLAHARQRRPADLRVALDEGHAHRDENLLAELILPTEGHVRGAAHVAHGVQRGRRFARPFRARDDEDLLGRIAQVVAEVLLDLLARGPDTLLRRRSRAQREQRKDRHVQPGHEVLSREDREGGCDHPHRPCHRPWHHPLRSLGRPRPPRTMLERALLVIVIAATTAATATTAIATTANTAAAAGR
mmetsp:Transcript_34764/g.82001  ORF Transcript_34764/g.82001 Transcript_34764/m.82001 type:complete len:350 (-) Transcript_34764:176-1225(-)